MARRHHILVFLGLLMPVTAGAAAAGEGPMASLLFESFVGPDNASLSGSWGINAGVKLRRGKKLFRLSAGSMLSLVPGSAYLSAVQYSALLYGGEILVGAAFVPMSKNVGSPYVEAHALLGCRMMKLDAPPVGIDATSVGITYGLQIGFGAQFVASGATMQAGVTYTIRRSSLANQAFNLNALGFELGYFF